MHRTQYRCWTWIEGKYLVVEVFFSIISQQVSGWESLKKNILMDFFYPVLCRRSLLSINISLEVLLQQIFILLCYCECDSMSMHARFSQFSSFLLCHRLRHQHHHRSQRRSCPLNAQLSTIGNGFQNVNIHTQFFIIHVISSSCVWCMHAQQREIESRKILRLIKIYFFCDMQSAIFSSF